MAFTAFEEEDTQVEETEMDNLYEDVGNRTSYSLTHQGASAQEAKPEGN